MIPEKAVQAARVKLEDVLGGWFDDLDAIRQILEAAAPHMLAGAWDDGFEGAQGVYHKTNPYRSQP